jgi:hypothetical protein
MADSLASAPRLRLSAVTAGEPASEARVRALEQAVDCAVQAPSVCTSGAWQIDVDRDRMVIRGDRGRLTSPGATERKLVQSVGAVLFNVRVALAARGWAAEVVRLPRPDAPDVLVEVRAVRGVPDTTLAALAPAVLRRRTNRRRFTGAEVPDEVLRRVTEIAEREGVQLVPVVHESHRRLVTRLTQRAGTARDGGIPLRESRTSGVASHDPGTGSDADRTMVLLATRTDDPRAWLRAGEAAQHVLLELTRLGWVGGPLPQAIEVPLVRMQLRAALTWDAHPQTLLGIGHAAPTDRIPRRRPDDVVPGRRCSWPPDVQEPPAPTG